MIGAGVAFAVLVPVDVAQYRTIQALVEAQRWEARSTEVVAQLEGASADLERLESSVRFFVLTGDDQPAMQLRGAQVREHLRNLRKLAASDPLGLADLDKLQSLTESKIAFLQRATAVRREQGLAAATQLVRQGTGLWLMTQVLDLTDETIAKERRLLATRSSVVRLSALKTLRFALLGDTFGLAFLTLAVWVIHVDIEKRKRAEEANRMLAAIVESTDDAVIAVSPNRTILAWNAGAEQLFLFTAGEVLGCPISILLPAERANDQLSIIEKISKGETVSHYETLRKRKDGRLVDVSLTVSALRDPDGRILGASSIARDITERKRTDEALRQSLATKEVLLREVHHRVKNNLQIIASLLNMQAEAVPVALQSPLDECQRRVRSMALVHEQSYTGDQPDQLDFGEYVAGLANDLFVAYSIHPSAVQLRLDLDPVRLHVDQAVPCGLILNELMTNSLKHGFPDGRAGEIRIDLHSREGQVILGVADTGIGLPPGFDCHQRGSLGLHIVDILRLQLNGRLECRRRGGAGFTLTFPKS
ncbi:MAG: PAS domain S-box protein [Acidobacteriia bacterium]|nr:PAS domain S-box protein [Terriglobia bacterium]